MSHFSVLVCLPSDTELSQLEEKLAEVMAPWDENMTVTAYRSYEDGSPEDFWFVSSARRGAEHHREGTGIKPYDPKFHGFSTVRTNKTPDQQRAEFAEDAALNELLGEQPTWETVVKLHNEKYHPGNELATIDDDSDSERLYYEAESGRAYRMSTYNPESKWDYWRIGGRWRDYFVAKAKVSGLVNARRDWDSPAEAPDDLPRCDGGRIADLDFEAMRAAAAVKANARYDKWEAICAATPTAKSWSHFYGLVDVKEIDIDTARRQYRDQPRIQRANQDDEFRWSQCPVEEFLTTREEYVAEARSGAVPGYALVTLKGEWVAPGRMGWFGMSSEGAGERSGYRIAVNTYLDELDPTTLLVVLDCHI